MNRLAHELAAIEAAAAALQHDSSAPLPAGARPFVQLIHRTASELLATARDIPASEAALTRIVPALGEAFSRPQASLIGYASMLLDHPEHFAPDAALAALAASQRQHLRTIQEAGQRLAQETRALHERAFHERLQQRRAPARAFALPELLAQQMPIYRFWLRDRPVQLIEQVATGLPQVHANAYHTGEILRHLVVTMGQELVEYGQITLQAHGTQAMRGVEMRVFCTGIRLLPDELEVLFGSKGRHIYYQQIEQQFGGCSIEREAGIGAAVCFTLPAV